MFPDDRVLVGVINRKRDLNYLLQENWYRIPQEQMPDGVYVEYIALYLSGSAARKLPSTGIYYLGRKSGVELLYRRDLLPKEANHKNADRTYYKVQFDSVQGRTPPITNPTNRPVSFIYTTWDRFVKSQVIADLYSQSDYFVDRIYHALRDQQIRPDLLHWDAQKSKTGYGAGFRIICEKGTLNAYTNAPSDTNNLYQLDMNKPDDSIMREIEARIASMGGLVAIGLPHT